MAKFTKKPVTIEAVWFMGINAGKPHFAESDSAPVYSITEESCPEWLAIAFAKGGNSDGGMFIRSSGGASWGGSDELHLWIKTLEGEMLASPGDWIIQGVAGELYPCKPDIFAESYDPATPAKEQK